ncbi:MAG TPA: hypothetical protein VMT20_00740 [Terriglobia bacterium]|nr:hypothetical protein [Terriglobia bacterium]
MKQHKVKKIVVHAEDMWKEEDAHGGEKWFLTLEVQLAASARCKIAGREQRAASRKEIKQKKQTQRTTSP